jgi:hypothetical protein
MTTLSLIRWMDENNKEWLVVKDGSADITKANQIMKLEWTKDLRMHMAVYGKEIDSGDVNPLLEYRRRLIKQSTKEEQMR